MTGGVNSASLAMKLTVAGDVGRATVAMRADALADGQRAQPRLRHEEAQLEVVARQQLDDRHAGVDVLAGPVERVLDPARRGRGDARLALAPCRLVDGRARRGDLRRLRADLLVAARQHGDRHLAFQLAHAGDVGVVLRAAVVERRARDAADCVLRLVAGEAHRRLLGVGARRGKLRARDVDLGGALAGPEVGQASLPPP